MMIPLQLIVIAGVYQIIIFSCLNSHYFHVDLSVNRFSHLHICLVISIAYYPTIQVCISGYLTTMNLHHFLLNFMRRALPSGLNEIRFNETAATRRCNVMAFLATKSAKSKRRNVVVRMECI